MPNMTAKIARNDGGGIVAKVGVHRENAQPRTSNVPLRSLKDLAANSIDRARKTGVRNVPGRVIEDLNVAMIAGPACAVARITKIDNISVHVRPSVRCRRLP